MLASKLTVMFTQANTRSSTERFDLEVRKLQSICELHTLHIGSPKDFPGFMRKLATDRHFAMDFWAFVGPLSSRERGEFSDEQMLSIIVESVTGGATPDDDPNLKRLVEDLGNLLAGVDVQSMPGFSEVEIVPFARSEPDFPASPENEAKHFGYADEKFQPFSNPDAGSESSADAPPSSVPQLDEALVRLESMSHELRRYMDQIEARLGKIDSHPEDLKRLAARPSIPKEPIRVPFEDRSYVPKDEPELKPAIGSRLVLEPAEPIGRDTNDLIPLESYSQRGEHRGLIWFVALLAVAIGGFSAQKYSGPLHIKERFGALVQKVRSQVSNDKVSTDSAANGTSANETSANNTASNNKAPNDQATLIGQNAPPQPTSAPVPPVAADAGGNSASSPSAHEATPPPASGGLAGPAPRNSAVSPGASQTEGSRADTRPREKTAPSREEPAEVVDSPLTPAEANAIKLPPSVMQGNLVVSRLAVYPELARANDVEGSVQVETIISSGGMVTHAHAIKGDPMLRSAAEEAVRRWRYRPYLVKGVPVEVSTTVTVDFKLNR